MVNRPNSEYLAEKLDNRDHLLQSHVRAPLQTAEQAEETLDRQLGPAEACRHALPPLCHGLRISPPNSHFLFGGKRIAVAVMFVFVTPGVLPIIEDLTAENVASDPPGMVPSAFPKDFLSHANGVSVDDLVCAVTVSRHESLRDAHRMVVSRLIAKIQAHECHQRRAVRQNLHVTGNEAKFLLYHSHVF